MSSDSDNDYSYTNSVSILKAITKEDISINDEIDVSVEGNLNLFDNSAIVSPTPTYNLRTGTKEKLNVIDLSEDEIPVVNIEEAKKTDENTANNSSCMILSDNEADVTPTNIISAIDSALKTRKRKSKCFTRKTRKSKRLQKNTVSAPIVKKPEIYIVEDIPDVEEINYEIPVKVWWKSQYIEKFTLRRFEKLAVIYKHFSEKENIPENRLLFTIRDKIISKEDTCDSFNITAATIIEGGILSETANLVSSTNQNEDKIELKVQLKDRKHPLIISLRSTDQMKVLMFKCAEELKIPLSNLKFYFDGDLIKTNDTPENLQLEGGECIDCTRTKM